MRKRKATRKFVKVCQQCWLCQGTGKFQRRNCDYCKGTGQQEKREQLLFCIGGPHNGDEMCETALGGRNSDYIQYNCANGGEKRRAVYIHESVIQG